MFSELIYQRCPISMNHYMTRSEHISAVVIHYAATIVKDGADVVRYWETKDYPSATYVIDVMGRITGVVPEELRPFTSGSFGLGKDDIDNRAITIECSCDNNSTLTVSDATIDACCKLMADIGHRYGLWWRFTGDKSGNVHVHKWYEYTPCPGEYLYSKIPIITDIANYMMYEAEDNDLEDIEKAIAQLEYHTTPVYHTLEEVPDWGKEEIDWLIKNGYLKGDATGNLNMSYDMLRNLVIVTRALIDKLYWEDYE